jgi:hypothetical protein
VVSRTPTLICRSLLIHYKQRDAKVGSSEGQSYLLRHDRALEVGFAAALYLLWPCEFCSTDHGFPAPYQLDYSPLLTSRRPTDPLSRRDHLHPLPIYPQSTLHTPCRLSGPAVGRRHHAQPDPLLPLWQHRLPLVVFRMDHPCPGPGSDLPDARDGRSADAADSPSRQLQSSTRHGRRGKSFTPPYPDFSRRGASADTDTGTAAGQVGAHGCG